MASRRRPRLARRLALAVALPIILLLGLGAVLSYQLVRMARDGQWVKHSDEVLRIANETLFGIVEQQSALRAYLITRDPTFVAWFERYRPNDGFRRLRRAVADNPGQLARFEEAGQHYDRWIMLARPIMQSEVDDLAAQKTALLKLRAEIDPARAALRDALTVETELRQTRVGVSEQSAATTKLLFALLLAASALLLAFTSRRRLSAIADEYGTAIDAETQAREAVEREAWIRGGHTKVTDAVRGELRLAQLGAECLRVLAEHAGASVGAFFAREGGQWQRQAGYALDERSAGERAFPEGEGLVGQVALDQRIRILREVPSGFLTLHSGTGAAGPVELVLLPATSEGRTSAVLELGFLKPLDSRTIELCERIGESIALAVRSCLHKQELRALLEEQQHQSEELRVQNEELEQQSRALQDSQTQLERQQSELEQMNARLEERTEVLARQRDDLARAQRDLLRANEYKSEFLANMSHELRTPLNSSLILAKLLSDNRTGNLSPEQVKFAQTIYAAGNDLLTLINDILDLSKIEAGKLDVRPDDVSLRRVTDELRSIFSPIAQEKSLALNFVLEDGLPAHVHTDHTRLQQILKNLLSNALKFTERGGVWLRVSSAGDGMLAFEVKDTGIGIASDQQEVIFEAFRQADGTTNRRYGGTGLGLSVSRELSRLLGGTLRLESAPGQGSTFTLVLPGATRNAEVSPTAPPRTNSIEAPARSVPERAESEPFADDRAELTAGARSLLLIGDDLNLAQILYDLAHELDFKALIAETAEDGLALAARFRPSAIVLDVGLPDRSGLSVLDALKHDPNTRHIPVHMMSVSDYTQTALQLGAAGFALKPVQREDLVTALERLESKFSQKYRRVLVIEDDPGLRESTCRLLASDGVETVPAATAADALEQLKRASFDCIVLDLTLPDRSGLELLEEIAQNQEYRAPPVVVYTGHSLSRDQEQALRRFSQSIIVKGARSPERLLDEVTLFLHQVETDLPPDRQRMLRDARHRESIFVDRRVLIVEDDVRNIFALSNVLEPKGARIEIARNGKEALAHLRDNPGVDLVLMDVMMPEMDGLEATRAIRKTPELAKLPIIALTAKAMADDRENCLSAGANDYIAKPIDVDRLLSLARVWMPK